MFEGKILIKETDESDLINLMNLWNNGESMKFVGFPNGLNYNKERIYNWYNKIKNYKNVHHFSIYSEEYGFCGETGYGFEDNIINSGLEIKLLPNVQGKGIAEYALRYDIGMLIENRSSESC
jgi:RimJ/RimL family protein N-acetyltransferase